MTVRRTRLVFFFMFPPHVRLAGRRRLRAPGTSLRLFPLNGSPLASVIGQLQRLVGCIVTVHPSLVETTSPIVTNTRMDQMSRTD